MLRRRQGSILFFTHFSYIGFEQYNGACPEYVTFPLGFVHALCLVLPIIAADAHVRHYHPSVNSREMEISDWEGPCPFFMHCRCFGPRHYLVNFLNMVIEGLKKMWNSFKKILVMLKNLIIHVVTRLYIGLGLRGDVLPVPSIGTIYCTRPPRPQTHPTRPRTHATAHSHSRPPTHAGEMLVRDWVLNDFAHTHLPHHTHPPFPVPPLPNSHSQPLRPTGPVLQLCFGATELMLGNAGKDNKNWHAAIDALEAAEAKEEKVRPLHAPPLQMFHSFLFACAVLPIPHPLHLPLTRFISPRIARFPPSAPIYPPP